MVWWFTSTRHESAITPLVRTWIRASFFDRFFLTFIYGVPWWGFWLVVSAISRDTNLIGLMGWVPWLFWIVDAIVDHYHTNGDIKNLMSRDDVVLATRAEYVGGHPRLPHGRFAYLALKGSRQNPNLALTFPTQDGKGQSFDIPLLDISETEPETEHEESLTQQILEPLLTSLSYRPGHLFKDERVTLNVGYQGLAGRKHTVEFTSFFRGNDEIRDWRNYLVCAQAEADTGITPFGPWKSLKAEPEEVTSGDGSRDGDKVQPARRAFERR
jgi:hypothetical protein